MIDIEYAAYLLKKDKLVAIPTETVYGLAGNAFSENAIKAIYETKKRPAINPLIFHIKELNDIHHIAKNIPKSALKLAKHFWPGPLTLILEKQEHISPLATAQKNTVGIRIPNHEITLQLLKKIDFPLVAPSANRSNHISPTNPDHVRKSLGAQSPFILDGGKCINGIESTIVGFKDGNVYLYRCGAIPKSDIEQVLRCEIIDYQNNASLEAPGMFKKHYSPNTPLVATQEIEALLKQHNDKKVGIISFQKPLNKLECMAHKYLSETGNLNEAAASLYAMFYEMDDLNLDLIIVELTPEDGIGRAINDRIVRAGASIK